MPNFDQRRNQPWQFYKEQAHRYDEWESTAGVAAFQTAEKRFLIDNIVPESRVIDFGCGTGEHLVPILDKLCKITGIDYVQGMLDVARTKVGADVVLICEDVRTIEFAKDSFDYGVCFCTLPNLEDFEAVFAKFAKIARCLIISVYDWESRFELHNFYSLNSFHPRIDDGRRQIVLDEELRYIFIDESTVRELFSRNGFEVNVHDVPFGKIYKGVKEE